MFMLKNEIWLDPPPREQYLHPLVKILTKYRDLLEKKIYVQRKKLDLMLTTYITEPRMYKYNDIMCLSTVCNQSPIIERLNEIVHTLDNNRYSHRPLFSR